MQILEHILKIRRKKSKAEIFAMCWQPLRISQCEISQCEIGNANFAMPNGCQLNANFNFAMPTSISQCQLQFRNANSIFATALPISHCEISHCEFSQQPCQFRNCIAKFATLRTDCEIPTVLPSDFVLRITFSSELRFRRFWYRWKA